MQANIILTETNLSGNKITTTISYVNPNAQNSQLIELAQSLSAFTTNSYVKTSKETKEDL